MAPLALLNGTRFMGRTTVNVDLSLIKQFPIRESVHLEFRAEVSNITNTANFSTPNVIPQNTSTYGTITAMSPSYSPRVIQFALKLMY